MKQQQAFISALFVVIITILLIACSKSPGGTSSNTTGGSGSGSGTGGTGGGGSTGGSTYKIETRGVIGGSLLLLFGKPILVEFEGGSGSNVNISLDSSATDLTVEIANNTQAALVTGQSPTGLAYFRYTTIKHGLSTGVVAADSAIYVTWKIKGFNAAVTGYNQINLVLTNNFDPGKGTISTAGVTPAQLTNSFITNVYSTTNKLGKSYIIIQ